MASKFCKERSRRWPNQLSTIKTNDKALPFLFSPGIRVYCVEKEAFVTLANGQECQTQQLGASWTSDIHATCYLECMIRYPETCQSIVYNADTKTCTPGAVAFHPLEFYTASIPWANSADQIYFAKQPVPPCDTSSGNFDLYDVCGVSPTRIFFP
ncbi:LOW QUALITY PROTEIN: hypothetical protein ElyMa_005094800 [Elysia marginata]|uniref:Apple domain-containing protein n=1 Tax=Elysia marginata TaxID=1093978 RepID=A0AAV4JJH0_9GAST|nr:LOW QUALITY PROTEIN: hypothetical protein ElyMa_005094800 [Elysia marginata]